MKWAIKLGIYWPRFHLVARLIETFSFEADRKKGYSSKILTDVVRLKGPPKMLAGLGFEKKPRNVRMACTARRHLGN